LQGLDLDTINGAVLARPVPADRARLAAEQELWAAQSDGAVAELAERISIGGRQALQGAGKAVKFVGKLGLKLA
jgi:hypothetical protein